MRTRGARNKTWADTQRIVIEAALYCFSERGFAQTTMDDIRSRAGISNGSLYHHFRSKESLAAAVYLQGIIDYQEGVLAALEAETGAREGVEAMVRHHLRWVNRQREWAVYLTRMRHAAFISEVESDMAGQNRSFMERVVAWFTPHFESGAIRPVRFDLLIPLLIGPTQEFTRLLLEGKTRTAIGIAADELAGSAWLTLRGPAAEG